MNFLDYLYSALGSIYVWGGQGETDITEAWIRKMETSSANAERVLKLWRKLKAAGKNPIAAYDCSGLIIRYMLDNGLRKNDTTAAGLYSECDKLNTPADLREGDLVFRHNGSKIHHVGVYVGNNDVIHARGRDYGVICERLDANGSDYWNRYGRIEVLNIAATGGEEEMAKVLKLTSPMMRGDDIKLMQQALNALGYSAGTPDGICGKNTMSAVEAFSKAQGSVKDLTIALDGKQVNAYKVVTAYD